MIAVGSKVFLKGCAFGQPGTVVRIERNRAVVLWHDLDYLARHGLESLMLTGELPAPYTSENHSCADSAGPSPADRDGKNTLRAA